MIPSVMLDPRAYCWALAEREAVLLCATAQPLLDESAAPGAAQPAGSVLDESPASSSGQQPAASLLDEPAAAAPRIPGVRLWWGALLGFCA